MPSDDLAELDLNDLVYLDLLLQECSVQAAAERAGRTPSALSHALGRLRERLGDPLLVRIGGRMEPTARARALHPRLREGLSTVRAALQPPQFDPATTQRTVRLSAPDLADWILFPSLLRRLRSAAPGLQVVVQHTDGEGVAEALATEQLDLAVLARPQLHAPGELVGQTLFRDRFACFLRRDHPLLEDGALSLSAYLAADHAWVSPRGDDKSPVDAWLAAQGHTRRRRLRVGSFVTAPTLVRDTDLVLTAPSGLRHALLPADPLTAVPLPLDHPEHAVAMFWHPRSTHDPGHVWLREQVLATVRSTGAGQGGASPRDPGSHRLP